MDKNNSCSLGCGCGCNSNYNSGCNSGCNNNNCRALMDKIQKICFAIDETILYLDVYPCSRDALAYYHTLMSQKKMLIEEYEAKCGPLTAHGNKSTTNWDWVSGPWPWEYKANI